MSYADERRSCMVASPPFAAAASLGEGRVRFAVPKRSQSARAKGEKRRQSRSPTWARAPASLAMVVRRRKSATTTSHLDYGSRTRAQTKELDEAELLARRIDERGAGGGARRRRSSGGARWCELPWDFEMERKEEIGWSVEWGGVRAAGVGATGGSRGRPAVPCGELAGAWQPRGVRALARSGERAARR